MTHRDDELLSMLLDGEAVDDADRAHVESCDQCRSRLAELRTVATLVATPVPPAPALARRRAIAAAVAAGEGATAAGVVRPLRRRARWADWGRPVLAAAAAVMALVIAVPLLTDGGGDDSGEDVALSGQAAGAVEGGDLGDLAAGADLGERVRGALEDAGGPGVAEAAETADGGADGATAADTAARSDAMAMETPGAGELAAGCEPVARRDAELGDLLYVATARWEGTPAVVLGFAADAGGGGGRLWVYVLAVEDCRVLNWQRS